MSERPNILIVLTDEQNVAMSSVYGHPFVQTPNMQRLADRGVTIESTYCNSPTCVPSRSCFMTGRYPHQIGAFDLSSRLSSEHPTWAHLFNIAGYETVLCGKMHFVGDDQMHGFRKRLVEDCHGDATHHAVPEWDAVRRKQPPRPEGYVSSARQRIVKAGRAERNWRHEYDYRVRDESVRYLKEYAAGAREQPFVLCTSFIAPHFPLVCEQKYFDLYYPKLADLPRNPEPPDHPMYHRFRQLFDMEDPFDPEQVKRCRAAYYGLITFVDELFGNVLDALEESGLSENTLVVFSSDHGEMLGERGLWWKSAMLEPAARVPMICSWPGRLPEGERRESVASLIDVVPTMLDAAGVDRPDYLEGDSMLALLEDAEAEWKDEAFVEYLAHGAIHPQACVRRGRYKFIYSMHEPPQLYDLAEDPDELVNLGGQSRFGGMVRDFERELLSWWPARELDDAIRRSQRLRRIVFQGQPPPQTPEPQS
jgi:choline-sulfatase